MKRTVLITGASRGIGAAIARVFAKAGDRVAICCFSHKEEAACLSKELAAETAVFCADIRRRSEVEKMIKEIHDRFGAIDVLINNAGVAKTQLFSDVTDEDYDVVCDSNLRGLFLVTQAVLPDMIHQKSGAIVNVSSIWGLSGASCEVVYSMTKAGIIGFTKALAKELGPSHIRVNAVAPGVIETEMNAAVPGDIRVQLAEETPLGKIGDPAEVAEAVFYLASEKASFITGQVLGVDGGFAV